MAARDALARWHGRFRRCAFSEPVEAPGSPRSIEDAKLTGSSGGTAVITDAPRDHEPAAIAARKQAGVDTTVR